LPVVEITSFVHPKWVPQLADAAELMGMLDFDPAVRYPVLVPNERGLDRALECGATEVAVFASATESFAQANLNRSYGEQWDMFEPVVTRARAEGLAVRGYVSMCFGDPWEGRVQPQRVADAVRKLSDIGCTEFSLGDTIGVATTGQVAAVIAALSDAGLDRGAIGVHFHDTYGQALANTIEALRHGITIVDASAGGLGGCPYAKSATGNLATEDLVFALDGLGIETGVDLDALVKTSVWMSAALGRPSPSRVVRAMTPQP
jgi:hydroxymethylglutaryl-CoA lyase